MITILFFFLWSVIPTALEGLRSSLETLAWVSLLPSLLMLVIWVDRMMLSRKEGRPA